MFKANDRENKAKEMHLESGAGDAGRHVVEADD